MGKKKKKKKEHTLNFILRSIGASNCSYCKLEREIIFYYKLVRNRFMHPEIINTNLNNQLKKIVARFDDGPFPNSYHEVSYSDFDLFTRTVKTFAEKLCVIARPSDDQIVAMAMKGDFKNLNRFKNKPSRYRNALSQKFRMVYSLQGKELNDIVLKYMGC